MAEPLALARDAILAPIGGTGLVEQTVRRLGEAIGLGILEVGERLPPEPELAERLGIAPMTLREALAILREAGYVETRRGRGGGTFVRQAVPPAPRRQARGRLAGLTVDDLRDLGDFRVAVSGAAAALAAERASAGEVETLRGLVGAMTRAEGWPAFRRSDARLHLAIASAARSARLVKAETTVQVELRELLSLIPHPVEALRLSNAQHRSIVEAIALRDPALARALMETHARGTGDFLIGLRLGQVGS
jgi:GntR family transcriptional repressor for pyruvate dehydrogenase complex